MRGNSAQKTAWDQLAERSAPSWYLDPLVGRQKRQVYQDLIRRWVDGFRPRTVLKTDVFEEAHGADQILFDLLEDMPLAVGMDVAYATVAKARLRCPTAGAGFFVGDVRRLPLASDSIDLVISTSTLDHFDTAEEFDRSLAELVRITRPGGRMIISLDNAYNPLYYPLRWASQRRSAPFGLGYTVSVRGLTESLQSLGLEVDARETLIHNPRLLSSALFTGTRRLLGRHADPPIRTMLRMFALLDALPTRWITGCFIAVRAIKPQTAESLV